MYIIFYYPSSKFICLHKKSYIAIILIFINSTLVVYNFIWSAQTKIKIYKGITNSDIKTKIFLTGFSNIDIMVNYELKLEILNIAIIFIF